MVLTPLRRWAVATLIAGLAAAGVARGAPPPPAAAPHAAGLPAAGLPAAGLPAAGAGVQVPPPAVSAASSSAAPPPSAVTPPAAGLPTAGPGVQGPPPAVSAASSSAAPPPVSAAPPPPDPETQALQADSRAIDAVRAQSVSARGDDALVRLRTEAAAAQASADGYVSLRGRELNAIQARLAKLSTKSGAARPRLTPAEQRERRTLLERKAKLNDERAAAQRVASAAGETYNAISNRRRASFTQDVFQRTPSPLEAGFWTSLSTSLQPDTLRLRNLVVGAAETMMQAPEPRAALSVSLALLIAFALTVPLRRLLKRASAGPAGDGRARSEFGRIARALAGVLIDTALPGGAAIMINLGLSWGELLTDKAEELMRAGVVAVFWGAAILALSRQLAGAADPEERVLSVSERVARRMAALPILVAIITGAGFLLGRINNVVGASLAATIATNCVVALAYAGVASLVLVALGAGAPGEDAAEPPPQASAPQMLLSLVLIGAIVVTVGAVFAGFTTFAALLSRQIFWISVLAAATYLVLRFVDAGTELLFGSTGLVGRLLASVLNLRVAVVQQIGVLTSALLQLLVVLAALGLGVTPFGRNGEMLSLHLGHVGAPLHLGSLTISPASVGAGVLILLLGLGISHLVERWVDRRYLPVTDWDAGVRNSVSTGVRYLGSTLAVLWALAAAGLGFRQIALVASALSVGIGFGLQQIVQNFVSGLILLVERPVKVGDWVNLGGVEGDVRRIRVRATEIQTFDRTTLIVPNSDLITKQVQNKTLGDPFGRVQLKFTIGAAADAPRASQVVEEVMKADESVVDDPAPLALIDSLTDGGSVNYVCYAYVASQRDAACVRSRLYGRLIEAFAEAKIGFVGGGPATVVVQPGEGLGDLVERLGASRSGPDPDGSRRATDEANAEPPGSARRLYGAADRGR